MYTVISIGQKENDLFPNNHSGSSKRPIYPESVDCRLFYSVVKRWQARIDVTNEATLIDNHFISSYPVFYI